VWVEPEWAARVQHSEALALRAMAMRIGRANRDQGPPNESALDSCAKAQPVEQARMARWAELDVTGGPAAREVRNCYAVFRRAAAGEGQKAAPKALPD